MYLICFDEPPFRRYSPPFHPAQSSQKTFSTPLSASFPSAPLPNWNASLRPAQRRFRVRGAGLGLHGDVQEDPQDGRGGHQPKPALRSGERPSRATARKERKGWFTGVGEDELRSGFLGDVCDDLFEDIWGSGDHVCSSFFTFGALKSGSFLGFAEQLDRPIKPSNWTQAERGTAWCPSWPPLRLVLV